jgi:hypothetical protein
MIGRVCRMHREMRIVCRILFGYLKGRDHLENLGVVGGII